MATFPGGSMRKVCRVLRFSRARLRARAVLAAVPPRLDAALAVHIQKWIERHPTFGYRRLWALLRFGEGIQVNPLHRPDRGATGSLKKLQLILRPQAYLLRKLINA